MSGPELLIEQAFASSHTAKLVLPFCGEDGATSIRAWALKIFPKIQAEQEPLANGSLPDDLVVAKRAVRLSVHRWFDSNLEQMPLEMFDGILLQGSKEDAAIQGEDFKEKIMPTSAQYGVNIHAAFVNRPQNEFIWIRSYESTEKLDVYNKSPERAAYGQLTGSHIAKIEVREVEGVIGQLSSANL